MSDEDLEKVELLVAEGLTQEQIAREMGYGTFHTFRVRLLEAGKCIGPSMYDVAERRVMRKKAEELRRAGKLTPAEPVAA